MKLEEVNIPKLDDHKCVHILKLLLAGYKIKLAGHECQFAESKNGGYQLFTTTDKDTVIGMDFTLEYFISQCNLMSDEDIIVASVNKVLNDIK